MLSLALSIYMDRIQLTRLGEHLKKMMILMAALCFVALSLAGLSMAADAQDDNNLTSYEGNLSQKEFTMLTMPMFFGQNGLNVAEAVKFKAPRAGWKLNEVNVLVWDGFNGTAESVPKERVVAIEVRDQDLNLLYRFADTQRAYTNYVFNSTTPLFMNVDLPAIPVSDEFYVCFYDRGAVAVTSEQINETSGNSFLYNRAGKEMVAATLPISDNQTANFNWIMQVAGS